MESDNQLKEALFNQMREHPKLDTSHMELIVNDGSVILKGRADTEEEKALAEQIATGFPGVNSVKNELHVDTGFIHAITSIVSGISASNDEELHKPGK